MLQPLMLLGLIGLSVPIIIHLIQRQRLKPQVLATLQFLEPQDAANAFAPVPRDLLQLLLRLMLLGLFVLLMARLLIGGEQVGPRRLAVILDQSMSMQRKVAANQTLFDKHKAQILDLIDGLGPDDKLNLMLVGDRITVETGYLQNKDELREIAGTFEVSDSGALALMPAIRTAVSQLGSRREVNACALVFSDHQQVNYQHALEETLQEIAYLRTTALRASLERGQVKVFLIDDQPEAEANLAIERASFSPEQVYVGASSRLTAVVRNYSDQAQNTTVRVYEGEQAGMQRSLALQPGETAHIDLVHRFESPVDRPCRVEIEEDTLAGDNRFYLPMRIHDRKQILLVAPATEKDKEDRGLEITYRGADLLTYALNPGEALGLGAGTYINVKRITPQRLGQVSLPIYSIIILYGVTDLPEQSAKDLISFVKNGGGVWLIPDRDVSPIRFNESYEKLLNGFTIGLLKRPDPVQTLNRTDASVSHPLFLPLMHEEWGNTRDIHFHEYYSVQSAGIAEVPLRAANGDWLAALVQQGRGRIFVQMFNGDLESSSLPRCVTFVPVVQQIVSVLGKRGEKERPDVMRVGEVHRMDLPEFRSLKGDAKVDGPLKQTFALTGPDAEEIRVEGLLKAGAYQVSHPLKKTSRERWLTVNPVQGESDLTTLSAENQTVLFGDQNVQRLPFASVAEQFTRAHEVTELLVVLVFVAFVIEALLGAWQARRKPQTREGVAA